jgi:hypothetical protein
MLDAGEGDRADAGYVIGIGELIKNVDTVRWLECDAHVCLCYKDIEIASRWLLHWISTHASLRSTVVVVSASCVGITDGGLGIGGFTPEVCETGDGGFFGRMCQRVKLFSTFGVVRVSLPVAASTEAERQTLDTTRRHAASGCPVRSVEWR